MSVNRNVTVPTGRSLIVVDYESVEFARNLELATDSMRRTCNDLRSDICVSGRTTFVWRVESRFVANACSLREISE